MRQKNSKKKNLIFPQNLNSCESYNSNFGFDYKSRYMKNSLKRFIVGGLITFGSMFASPDNASGLERIVQTGETKTEQRADSTAVKKEKTIKELNINGGGDFNDVSNRGYFGSGINLRNIEVGFSYDYVGAKNVRNEYLKKEAKTREKRLLIASVQYSCLGNSVFGMSYDSDGELGFYSTLFKGGFQKQFSHGLYLEGFMGLKVGKVNLKSEKEDVIGGRLKYVLPREWTNNIIGLSLNASCHLPRKYVRGGMLEGPWIGDFIGALTFPVWKNVRFGVDYNLRRDFIAGLNESITRKGMRFRASFENEKSYSNERRDPPQKRKYYVWEISSKSCEKLYHTS